MIKVFRLGYAELFTKNLQPMLEYYTEVMGLILVEKGEDQKCYLSNGLEHHHIVLTPGDSVGLAALGLQISKQISLHEAVKILEKEGIPCRLKVDAKPGIKEFVELKDPSGYTIHLYQEMELPAPGFSKKGIVPNKLGHIALGSTNVKKTLDFYMNVLGFHLTDRIGDYANFITCNSDHHVMNIANLGHTKMHHIAFELRDASHQYYSHDLLLKHGIQLIWGPARHTAGHNIASYHFDPDFNVVELFIDMDQYIPELGYFEPRPWHEKLPLKPRNWSDSNAWGTPFSIPLKESALKNLNR